MDVVRFARMACIAGGIGLWFASAASAQTSKVPPAAGFVLHDEKAVDRFIVQRWVSLANPEVSPAGFCECMTIVYEGTRRLFTPSVDPGITSVSTVDDVTGDQRAELVFSTHSGGAHCCYTTSLYSIEGESRRRCYR
jgi:hypothetical protein